MRGVKQYLYYFDIFIIMSDMYKRARIHTHTHILDIYIYIYIYMHIYMQRDKQAHAITRYIL